MEITDQLLAVLKEGYKEDTLHRLALLQVQAEGSGDESAADVIDKLIKSIASHPASQHGNLCRMAYALCNHLWGGDSTADDVQDALDDFDIQELRNNLGI